MSFIAITGPRKLTQYQRYSAHSDICSLPLNTVWLIGDAAGIDALTLEVAKTEKNSTHYQLFRVNPDLPHRARFAERSTRMVKALAAHNGTLHAWPNKPAPQGLKPAQGWPQNANGSGTWGTIALAVGLDLEVVLHPLTELEPVWWLRHRQLTLI